MFISVTFRILSFRSLPFIPQKKSASNFPQITRSQLSAFRIPQNTPSQSLSSSTTGACLLWQPMGWCVHFINILDSLTAPCLVYNSAMYPVYGQCSRYGQCMVYTDPIVNVIFRPYGQKASVIIRCLPSLRTEIYKHEPKLWHDCGLRGFSSGQSETSPPL